MTDEQESTDVSVETDHADGEAASEAAASTTNAAADPDASPDGVDAGANEDQDLVARVEESDAERLAEEIRALRERNADLEAEVAEREETVEDLESRLKRKQAEFQNYKKRMDKRREQEQQRATEDLVSRLVDVRDNLKRGLEQDGDIREGVESTLRQFDEVLEGENVEEIAPDPGADVDPQRHEVLMRVESDHPAGTVDEVHRSGYEMAEKVIRPAQVTVSDDE
ncbi:nucleotide exchange factor GrpE [Halomarina litorea]|uniref:nucleotide exchange factor GrpE n=1 Tax=Halomarina litorea TaxID=2961595 RepID=UPI0020C4700E|nr:nucleotide exchange factor GrpE [Halomarina sp. BCD28]